MPNMLQISKTRRDTLYLWKHSTRHYRGSYEAGRATNQQSIHHVRPWSSQFWHWRIFQGVDVFWKSAEGSGYGTIVERYLEDDQYRMRMHEQGYTHSDMEEFDTIASGNGFTSLLLTKGSPQRPIQGRATLPGRRPQHHKNTQYTKRLYSGKRRTWPDNPQFPMLNCDHRGLQWHGHLHRGLHGGLLRHRKRGDTITITYVWCPSIRLEHKEEHKHRATSCCDTSQIVKICFSVIILRLDGRRVTIRTEVYTDTRSHAHFVSVPALRWWQVTHSVHFSTFTVQGRIEKSFHQVIRRWLALPECDGYRFHNHQLTLLLLRCICSRTGATRLAIWRYTKQTQVMSPNVSTNANVSISTSNGEMVTMTTRILTCSFPRVHIFRRTIMYWSRFHELGATPCKKITVFGRYQFRLERILGKYSICHMSSKCTCSSWTPRSGSVGHTTSTRRSEWSARNSSRCSTPTTRIISCCHSSIWNGCEAKPYQYFDKKLWSTQLQRADASSATGTWSGRAVFPGSKSSSWKSARNFGYGSDSRDAAWQQSQACAGLQQHLTGLVEVTQQYGEMFEESSIRPHESITSEHQQIIRDLRSEIMQLRASAVPPTLNRNLEAKIESQKYELQSSERSTDNTGFTDQWHEVNLISIQGVYVDDRVATSTSSVIMIPEPAISHLPPAGGDPEPFLQKKEYNAESSFKIGCSSKYTTSENFENSSGSTQFPIPTTSFTTGKYRSYSDSPWLWRTQKERSRGKYDWQMASTNGIQKLEIELQKRILSFFATSQNRYAMDWWSWGC